MIERIARRAGGFASTTALRWLGAAHEAAPDVVPHVMAPSTEGRMRKPLVKSAVAGAVVLVSSNKVVRAEVAKGLQRLTEALRTDAARTTARPKPSSHPTTNGTHRNGGNGSLSTKTRAELYEIAKQKDVPRRSTMSKQELAKALADL